MSQIQWSHDFETGNEIVDGQHQHLVEIVNKFEVALAQGKGRRVLGEIFKDLIGYTQEHFSAEEDIMAGAHYPGLQCHAALHHQLLHKVKRYQFDFTRGKRLSREIHDFLNYWLMNHIMVDDKAFAAWQSESTGQAPEPEEAPAGV